MVAQPTDRDVESTRNEYVQAQALADEAFAALLESRKPWKSRSDQAPAGDVGALDLWVRRREVADALAIRYFHVTRGLGALPQEPRPPSGGEVRACSVTS